MCINSKLEYENARKKGNKIYNVRKFSGQNPYIPVMDNIIRKEMIFSEVQLRRNEIPISKIKGTKTVGRAYSFAFNFMPILELNTEFGSKWINLCDAHINEGIRDPIKVYEYLNWFYVEEGNKRVSVLKHFRAELVSADITRLIPRYNPDDEMIVIYYEFLEFYKQTQINYVWMSKKDGFNKLLLQMRKHNWLNNDYEFNHAYYIFRKIYHKLGGNIFTNTTGDAFLRYLEIYNYSNNTSTEEIKSQLQKIWKEFKFLNKEEISLEFSTKSLEKRSFLDGITASLVAKKSVNIAFVNAKSPKTSNWTYGHEIGRNHIENLFGNEIHTKAFDNVPEDELAYEHIVQVVREGYDIVFTTSPTFINATLKAAVEFKNVKFFNCSENMSFKRVRTYFGRIYEPNFLVGMIAGAMTKSNRIGYVVTYPIPEIISSINAFTIGARFVNPHTKIIVKWVSNYKTNTYEECYDIDQQLMDMGADIIYHQESSEVSTKFHNSGIYLSGKYSKDESPNYIATAIWNWGKFYEKMVQNIISGAYGKLSNIIGNSDKAISYWWGMDTEVVDIVYSPAGLPRETIQSINFMKDMIIQGIYNPFTGPLYDNKGNLKLEENLKLEPSKILTMDWFIEGVLGSIPSINTLEANHPLLELLSVKKKY